MVGKLLVCSQTTMVEIEDEHGIIFPCKVNWGERPTKANIGSRWSDFCAANNLEGGSTLELCVDPKNPTKFFSQILERSMVL